MDSEKRFQQIAENVGEWIWEVDVTGLYTYASPSVEKMLGYTPEKIVGKKRFYDLFSPENREQLKKTFFKLFIKQESFHEFIHQDIHKNGDIVWLSSSGQPIVDRQGNLHGYRGVHRNITEIKRSEEALRQSEAQKRAILDASIDQIRLVDTDRRIIWANKTATRELNIAPEDIAGQFCYDVFVGRDSPCPQCPTEKALKSGTIEHATLHIPHLKGIKEETYWDSYAVPIKDESGDIVTIIQITRNITQRVNAENALRIERDNFVNILNSMEDYVYIIDDQYNIEYANPSLMRNFGSIKGKKCYEYLNGQKKICPWCKSHEVVEGKVVRWEWHSSKDNKAYDVVSTPLKNIDGSISRMQLFRDVKTIKMLQEQLLRSERLAASGQLAASIAHEINSPLQAISFTLSAIKKNFPQEKGLEGNIDLLKQEFESIRDTVKNLLDLNRPKQDKKQQTNINSVIKKTIALLQGRLKKGKIAIDLKLSPTIPDITASPQQLNHVFLNIVNNAIEAIKGISRTQKVEIGLKTEGKITVNSDLKNGVIVISIADNGPGISNDDLEHVFDPFYTRKKTMGLGVGLSICHDIVKDHGGILMAKNRPNGGAVFTITLPCSIFLH